MRQFTRTELERMQAAQTRGMQDLCVMLEFDDTQTDSYGMPVTRWVEGNELACGFEALTVDEAQQAEAPVGDVRLRLPIETPIETRNRIRMTKRFGVLLKASEQLDYEIVGDAKRGPSGLVLTLKRLEVPTRMVR